MEKFEQFLVVEKGLQAITILGYVGSVKRMAKVIGYEPTEEKIKGYVYMLYTSSYSYAHKTNSVLAIERYSEFLGRPLHLGRQKKPKQIIKNTLTEAEVTKLIFNAKNIREKAIVTLLAYSGIRNLELCSLRVRDFLPTQNAVRIIKGKGLKDGLSEISPECTEILMKYLEAFPRGQDEFFFTTLVKKHNMATGDIRKLVKVLARRAEITKRVYPHLLRHSLSVNLLLRGANIMTLKQQLRHSLVETTLHYINSIVFIEKNQFQKFVPSYI
jgi:integrase/recombinase XerD